MGNFIENTFSGIGDAVSGLFGGRGSGSSRPSVGQQVQDAAKQKAMEDRYADSAQGDLTEDQMNELRAKSIFNSPNVTSGRGMVSGMKKGGKVKAYANGGSVSASSRGDGIAQRGKTKGRMC
jgi:hypothetical protein